jgi:hypothetical protein
LDEVIDCLLEACTTQEGTPEVPVGHDAEEVLLRIDDHRASKATLIDCSKCINDCVA